jgi:hypothetical protein
MGVVARPFLLPCPDLSSFNHASAAYCPGVQKGTPQTARPPPHPLPGLDTLFSAIIRIRRSSNIKSSYPSLRSSLHHGYRKKVSHGMTQSNIHPLSPSLHSLFLQPIFSTFSFLLRPRSSSTSNSLSYIVLGTAAVTISTGRLISAKVPYFSHSMRFYHPAQQLLVLYA